MMRRRKRKRKLPLFGLVLLLVVVMGVTLLLTGWTVLGEEAGLEAVAVTGTAILPQESEAENASAENGATGKYAELLSSPERMAAQNMIPLAPQKADEISLVFAGDILFDDNYSIMVKMKGRAGGGSLVEAGFDAAILQEMRGADIFMVNNEFTYTTRGTPTEGKAFTFRAKPEHAALLSEMGADIVSLANNHVYDYGEISLLDTLDTLTAAGMPYVGAGRNLTEAVRPVYFVT